MNKNTDKPRFPASPFDALAEGYDAGFTHTPIGRLMRQAVWARMEARFQPGQRILELNCGTGEDAIYLAQRGVSVVATDASGAMVAITQAKVAARGLQDQVQVCQFPLEDLVFACMPPDQSLLWDGALSNFGGLNCVEDWGMVSRGLAQRLRPGAVALLCVMGPNCPWEWIWYLRERKPDKAFRRWKPRGVPWRGLTIRYPSLRKLRAAFRPEFRLLRASAIGLFVPPSYAGDWAERHPKLLATLNRWERRIEAWPFAAHFGDHYLLELERTEDRQT